MSAELEASYTLCRKIARRSASNFYHSFRLLPRTKRLSMCALYAFLRRTDDLGDSDVGNEAVAREARATALADWRQSLARSFEGTFDDPLLPAFVDTVERFKIPREHLYAVLDGVESDLNNSRYETFAELEQYCYRVASAVGLACIHVWGFRGAEALPPARDCGLAFQLTNILRDLKEDAGRNRVYLPQEDLRRFGYTADELQAGVYNEPFRNLMAFQVERAEGYYRRAADLDRWLEPEGRRIFGTMFATYRALLDEIKHADGDVLSSRIALSGWQKIRIAARGLLFHPRAPIAAPAGPDAR